MLFENARWADTAQTNVLCTVDGLETAILPESRMYQHLLNSGVEIAPFTAPKPITMSTYWVKQALTALGHWDTFKTFLNESDMLEDFLLTTELDRTRNDVNELWDAYSIEPKPTLEEIWHKAQQLRDK